VLALHAEYPDGVNQATTLDHGALDFHRTTGCVDRAGKFDHSTVTRVLDYTAAVFDDFGIKEFAIAVVRRALRHKDRLDLS